MADKTSDLLQGALELLILRTLRNESRHGWGILKRIEQISEEAFTLNQGSLYPALYRLEKNGYIKSEFGVSENNRRAKYYELTAEGRTRLESEIKTWSKFSKAVGLILEFA